MEGMSRGFHKCWRFDFICGKKVTALHDRTPLHGDAKTLAQGKIGASLAGGGGGRIESSSGDSFEAT